MLDWPGPEKCNFGTKVAVTATTNEDSAPCMISNYGSANRVRYVQISLHSVYICADILAGYKVVKGNPKQVLIWEA
jgi:hypothetical protein